MFLKGKNKWDMAFGRNGSFDAEDQGDQYKVLSTVIAVFVEFVNKVKPAKITFDADKDSTNSRADVYSKMLARYASKMGYTFTVKNPEGDSILQYTLTKKKPTTEATEKNYEVTDDVFDEPFDPETTRLLNKVRNHYPQAPNDLAAILKFVQRSSMHGEEEDNTQDNELSDLTKRVADLEKKIIQQTKNGI